MATALLSGSALAQEPPFIAPADVDPTLILPPPPAPGSEGTAAEIAELHRIQAARSAEALARAQWDAEHETVWLYATVLGPKFNADALPATAALFAKIKQDAAFETKRGKSYFARPRPFTADPTIVGCPHSADPGKAAYPSGHATLAYSTGVVLAALIPDRAQTIMARASDYSENRLVCGHHYRRDVEAGQTLGTALAVTLLHNQAFRTEMEASKAELHAAGF